MSDTIVYLLITRTEPSAAAVVQDAYLTREQAEKCSVRQSCTIKPEVFDLEQMATDIVARLSPVERIALAVNPRLLAPHAHAKVTR